MSRKNVFGRPLKACSHNTGWTRNGFCEFDAKDDGTHTVCAIVTDDFLKFTFSRGNNLITPRLNFRGLRAGDQWCMCVGRWIEAFHAGVAPPVVLDSTDESVLQHISLNILREFSHVWMMYNHSYNDYNDYNSYNEYNEYGGYGWHGGGFDIYDRSAKR